MLLSCMVVLIHGRAYAAIGAARAMIVTATACRAQARLMTAIVANLSKRIFMAWTFGNETSAKDSHAPRKTCVRTCFIACRRVRVCAAMTFADMICSIAVIAFE
jgi:hypothetical protein